jgi:3-dehydro-L-gulonate 2-dehydrogenase
MANPGIIRRTNATEVSIHAVAPVSISGVSAASSEKGRTVNARINNGARFKILILVRIRLIVFVMDWQNRLLWFYKQDVLFNRRHSNPVLVSGNDSMKAEDPSEYVRIPSSEMEAIFARVLTGLGVREDKASSCAAIFTANSVDGIYTHGVNRFPRFVTYLREGYIDPKADPVCYHRGGSIEQWDGRSGLGPTNAIVCTDRAMEIAATHGIGCVAIANTNHWMRGGTYGWRAAQRGFAFIGWTNTIANMPPWGAVENKLGNNPLVVAVPKDSDAIVLDMAMSQFSYGALEFYAMKNQTLPVPGGFSSAGELTTNPSEIAASQRILPTGYWKGAGLSLLLDILATILSGGLSVADISKSAIETNVSQVFVAFDLKHLENHPAINRSINTIIEDYQQAQPVEKAVMYPGERVKQVRQQNLTSGVPVLRTIWNEILAL